MCLRIVHESVQHSLIQLIVFLILDWTATGVDKHTCFFEALTSLSNYPYPVYSATCFIMASSQCLILEIKVNISITKALKNSFSRAPVAFLSDQRVVEKENEREEGRLPLVILILWFLWWRRRLVLLVSKTYYKYKYSKPRNSIKLWITEVQVIQKGTSGITTRAEIQSPHNSE